MNLYDYWRKLSKSEKSEFAVKAVLSEQYIETHLIHRRKKPLIETMQRMAEASDGEVSYDDLFTFFYTKHEPAKAS
jgi:uncharacterized protein HemY